MGKIAKHLPSSGGFTLIELLTVSGIMTLLALTIVSMFLATLRGGNKAQLIQQLHQNGDYAIKTIATMVRSGTAVTCGSDLTVTLPTGVTITYGLVSDGEVTRIASDSSKFLTGTVAEASDFTTVCYQGYLGNQVVTFGFTLTAGGETGSQVQEQFTRDFATSTSTRNQ